MSHRRSDRERDRDRDRDRYDRDRRYDDYDRRDRRYDGHDRREDDRYSRRERDLGHERRDRHGQYRDERHGRDSDARRPRDRSASPGRGTKETRAPEPQQPAASNGQTLSSEELKRQEKLRERQKRRLEWKEAESRRRTASPSAQPDDKAEVATNATSGVTAKTAEPIAAKEPVKPVVKEEPTKPGIRMLGFGGNRPVKARAHFSRPAMDDDDRRRPMPRLPGRFSGEFTQSHDVRMKDFAAEEEEDPLDAFMSQIGETDGSETASMLPSKVMDEDEDDEVTLQGTDEPDPERYMALLEQKKKKDVPVVDHSQIDYEPFRKTFYIEPKEVKDMSAEDVDMLRLELDGIKVRGKDCPKPVVKWEQFGIPTPTMEVIRNLNYEKPTSIQSQAIPAIMSGRDVIGVAKTGSGKTMAFLLPLFRHVKDQRPLAALDGPIALIMTPTRELALQIFKESKPLARALDLRVVCAYGGTPLKEQIADFKRGAEIVVCTPGRMIDLLTANSGRVTNLRRVTYLVLDEADRMFDMGFEPQVLKIVRNIRPGRQTVLFSATFPRQMEALARKILINPIEIITGARSVVAPEITQKVEVRADNEKFVRLLEVLGEFFQENGEESRAIIFVERQEDADQLLKNLLARGYPCMSIHGGKDQMDRDSAINDFKNGVVNLLVATSVAARGLDVKQLKLVVNYDSPSHMEDYVHRVGRTGRAGNTGTAITFVNPGQERSAFEITRALTLSKADVPAELQALADKFSANVKEGKERFAAGFGGKGLEKLDEVRTSSRRRERKAYGEDDEPSTAAADSDDDATPGPSGSKIPAAADSKQAGGVTKGKLQIIPPAESKGSAGKYHAILEINDFPDKARLAVTRHSNTSKIIETNSTSLTTKGEYYPHGKSPGENDEPKLYILIEGRTEASVEATHKALVALLMDGIEAANEAKAASSRYTIA